MMIEKGKAYRLVHSHLADQEDPKRTKFLWFGFHPEEMELIKGHVELYKNDTALVTIGDIILILSERHLHTNNGSLVSYLEFLLPDGRRFWTKRNEFSNYEQLVWRLEAI